jgi:hypothetical protein
VLYLDFKFLRAIFEFKLLVLSPTLAVTTLKSFGLLRSVMLVIFKPCLNSCIIFYVLVLRCVEVGIKILLISTGDLFFRVIAVAVDLLAEEVFYIF